MGKEKAWVWFKGGLKGGLWEGGFLASKSQEGGITIERADFVTCRVPDWRVKFDEPKDLLKEPEIPKEAIWKYI